MKEGPFKNIAVMFPKDSSIELKLFKNCFHEYKKTDGTLEISKDGVTIEIFTDWFHAWDGSEK